MGLTGPARPRVSRETRLLFATIIISIAALWVLARMRFPERPVTTNPVPPLLTQLTDPPGFDDLATEISKLDSRVLPSLEPVGHSLSLRVRDAVGAILLPGAGGKAQTVAELKVIARDPASGFALVGIPGAPAPELTPWTAQRFERSRYLISGDASPQGASLRPVFIGRPRSAASPAWPGNIWILPARTDVSPGEFLFTTDGAFAGLVIAHAGALALVPGATVLQSVEGLLARRSNTGGWLGVETQLMPGRAASAGVMIAWVDPNGPAAGKLFVMDVVETAGGAPVTSPEEWRVRAARLQPGESIVLRVRRGAETIDVSLAAAAQPTPADPSTLGLTMRTVRGVGAEILEVADGSSAARAGLREGDVITAIGDIPAPTALQVTRTFVAAPAGRPLYVAITRGDLHRVLALEKVKSEPDAAKS